jgi:hypothetical protein
MPIGLRAGTRACAALGFIAWLALQSRPLAADVVIDAVPLPDDIAVATLPATAPSDHRRLLGAWVGAWEDAVHHVLIVENIQPNGNARVVYAVAENPWAGAPGAWHRHAASVLGGILKISKSFNATYKPGDAS